MTSSHKTIVIGGGPGGSAAAIYLARFNHDVLLLDAAHKIPGRTAEALHLENVLGFTRVTPGPEFMKDIHTQLQRFNIERREEVVTKVETTAEGFTVMTDKPAHYKAEFVVVAVGVSDIMPSVPEVELYFGHSLFQCPTCNWYQTKDHKTGIISNDDAGITSALVFDAMKTGSCLFVVPDRPNPHYSPAMIKKASERNIKVLDCPVVSFNGKDGRLHSITLSDGTELEAEIIYTKLGVKRHDLFLDNGGTKVDRTPDGYLKIDYKTFETSVPNLFAVGPCNEGPDQVMISAGQGVSAAMEIHRRVLTEQGI